MSDKNVNEFEIKGKVSTEEKPCCGQTKTESPCEGVKIESRETTEKGCPTPVPSEIDLQEVYKNAFTGKESVEILRSFSADKSFRNVLIRQYKEYAALAKDIELCANRLGYDLKKTSFFAKSMMYVTTAINTLTDKSDSKLSEIYIQGINMGIIAMTKLINKLNDENKTLPYANSLLSLLQKDLEEMKLFL